MPNDKPLPAIPASPPPSTATTLTIEARKHRLRFIRQVLQDSDAVPENAREAWAQCIEEALDELSMSITRGGWLAGIRHGRALGAARRIAERKAIAEKERDQESVKGSRNSKSTTQQKNVPTRIPSDHSNSSSDTRSSTLTISQVKDLVAQSLIPVPKSVNKHLLLCVAPLGSRIAAPKYDPGGGGGGGVALPDTVGCRFSAGVFTLPDEDLDGSASHSVLFGLDGWNAGVLSPEDGPTRLVGGTFTFVGVTSSTQYTLLTKALRIATYVHFSLILEQHFLANSHVQLHFPKPRIASTKPHSFQTQTQTQTPSAQFNQAKRLEQGLSPDDKTRQRNSFLPSASGLLSFFSKKAGLYRSSSIVPVLGRGTSLDLDRPIIEERTPRSSEDNPNPSSISPLRRFSFIGDPRPSFLLKSSPTIKHPHGPDLPFATTIKRINQSKDIYSTSLGVCISPPSLIVDLAEKERVFPKRRLKGDERTGLMSVLGWEGKEDRGGGMSGTVGFVRHQGFSVLYSQHVPSDQISLPPPPPPPPESSSSSSRSSLISISVEPKAAVVIPCGQPRWVSYRYYCREEGKGNGKDQCMGEVITEWVSLAKLACENAQCKWKRGEHEMRFVHGGIRICVKLEEGLDDKGGWIGGDNGNLGNVIEGWASCAVCGAKTERSVMSDGTYLFSFAKFLELLVYSPRIVTLNPSLCEHTASSVSTSQINSSSSFLPQFRLNIIRHFHLDTTTISFSLSPIEEIFELKVPRLQILRSYGEKISVKDSLDLGGDGLLIERGNVDGTGKGKGGEEGGEETEEEREKRNLRREIKGWWEGVADHMDKLEDVFHGDNLDAFRKALPRLPSSDDAYENDENENENENNDGVFELDDPTTPTKAISGLPSSRTPISPTPQSTGPKSNHYFERHPSVSSSSTITTSRASSDPTQLLSKLRHTFQRIEQSLYVQLSRTPIQSLNDVRRSFLCASKGASKRLLAWQQKHLPSEVMEEIGDTVSSMEPEWWAKGCHAVPGGNVIVREDDWGSIIAFTLGTPDYQRELASMFLPRAKPRARRVSSSSSNTAPTSTPTPPPSITTSTGTSFFSPSRGFRFFSSSTQNQPDPDKDDVIWHEPEAFSAVISRKEHPKDGTYLMSIRDVLRQKAGPADGSSPSSPSRFGSIGAAIGSSASASARAVSGPPPSAWAKPDVQVSMQAAGGEVCLSLPDNLEGAERILQEIGSAESSRPGSAMSGSFGGSLEGYGRHGKAVSSTASIRSDVTIGKEREKEKEKEKEKEREKEKNGNASVSDLASATPPEVPPKDTPSQDGESQVGSRHQASASDASFIQSTASTSSFTSTFTNSIGYAMRLISTQQSQNTPPSIPPKNQNHHALLTSTDINHIDDKPHIKYDWTVGTRLKFSCTVYYAKQFDLLRKRCGIEDVYLRSLRRSMNWAAEGGKSRSNFWKTEDDRFIIKTLVNAWNVADLQVLLELAPSYFRYMEATANRSTVLAKLLGFYTIEIRNLEAGTVQAKADLLVMENLFYQHKIVKTFDLKGIQGRKVKPGSNNPDGSQQSKTLFDGEWIEGQQRTLTLVRPHSKVVLREAIRNDADFLAKSNIMDYSLLLGVDEEHKQIACGLVDTIGSYTFAKTLEYKAKQGLNSGKEVTVIPPAEYQERFVNALERYFLPCPDKWSQPMDDTKVISDPNLLPSVL